MWIVTSVLYIALGVFTYAAGFWARRHGQPRYRSDRRSDRLVGGWLLHQSKDGRLGIHHGGAQHRVDAGNVLLHDLPQRDALHPQPGI